MVLAGGSRCRQGATWRWHKEIEMCTDIHYFVNFTVLSSLSSGCCWLLQRMSWEVAQDNIKLLSELGQGSLGWCMREQPAISRTRPTLSRSQSRQVTVHLILPCASCYLEGLVWCVYVTRRVTGIVFVASAISLLFFMLLKILVYLFVSSKITIQYYNLIALKI